MVKEFEKTAAYMGRVARHLKKHHQAYISGAGALGSTTGAAVGLLALHRASNMGQKRSK